MVKSFPLSTHREEMVTLITQHGETIKESLRELEMPLGRGDWNLIPQWMSAYTAVLWICPTVLI